MLWLLVFVTVLGVGWGQNFTGVWNTVASSSNTNLVYMQPRAPQSWPHTTTSNNSYDVCMLGSMLVLVVLTGHDHTCKHDEYDSRATMNGVISIIFYFNLNYSLLFHNSKQRRGQLLH